MNKNLLLIPVFVAAVTILIFPFVAFYGDRIMIITSDSMEPVLEQNDVIIVRPSSMDQIDQNDIIAFDSHMEMGIVAHRAVEIHEDGSHLSITTKGDNEDTQDPWLVTDDSLIGKVVHVLPNMGFVMNPIARFALVGIVIVALFFLLRNNLHKPKKI